MKMKKTMMILQSPEICVWKITHLASEKTDEARTTHRQFPKQKAAFSWNSHKTESLTAKQNKTNCIPNKKLAIY